MYLGRFIVIASVTSLTLFQSNIVLATDLKESDFKVLQDDPSRASLFEDEIIPARLAEDEVTNTGPISFAIPKEFWFPDDAKYDAILNKPRANSIFGVDVSHHSGSVNFKNFKVQKIDFVYVKATQGTGFKDGKFHKFWSDLAELPIDKRVYRGAYHFLSANGSAENQAKSFIDYMSINGGLKKDDMPPCVDLEWDRTSTNPDQWKGQNSDAIIEKTLKWLAIVEQKTGRKPIIYTARSWWRERIGPESKFSKLAGYDIWIADYSRSHKALEKPSVINGNVQAVWQFADNAFLSSGIAPGKGIDANIFYGSMADFETRFGIVKP
jgi:lysozyme